MKNFILKKVQECLDDIEDAKATIAESETKLKFYEELLEEYEEEKADDEDEDDTAKR